MNRTFVSREIGRNRTRVSREIGSIPEKAREWVYFSGTAVAMRSVAERRDLSIVMLTTYQGKLALIEGVAHELAHQLEGGPDFERRIRAAGDEKANDHEAATLRIEVAGLALLGVHVSLRHLWRDANWRSERPKLTGANRLLSRREQRCAMAFSRIVGAAVRKIQARRVDFS